MVIFQTTKTNVDLHDPQIRPCKIPGPSEVHLCRKSRVQRFLAGSRSCVTWPCRHGCLYSSGVLTISDRKIQYVLDSDRWYCPDCWVRGLQSPGVKGDERDSERVLLRSLVLQYLRSSSDCRNTVSPDELCMFECRFDGKGYFLSGFRRSTMPQAGY